MATIPDTTASSLASSILSSLGTLSGTTSNVGSNLNISALVTQLVAADRSAPQAQITRQTNSTNGEVSALGSLMGALGTFQSALQKVADPTAFNANKASSSNSAVVTATVEKINAQLVTSGQSLQLSVDSHSRHIIVVVRDTQTGTIIRQLPSEEVLRLASLLGTDPHLLIDLTV